MEALATVENVVAEPVKVHMHQPDNDAGEPQRLEQERIAKDFVANVLSYKGSQVSEFSNLFTKALVACLGRENKRFVFRQTLASEWCNSVRLWAEQVTSIIDDMVQNSKYTAPIGEFDEFESRSCMGLIADAMQLKKGTKGKFQTFADTHSVRSWVKPS